MIRTIKKYLKLIEIVLKHGRWKHSGENFNQRRRESLIELQDFVPHLYKKPGNFKNIFYHLSFGEVRARPSKAVFEIPLQNCRTPLSDGTTLPFRKNAIARNLVAQLAFLKKSLPTAGGHLTANKLSYIRIAKSASTSMCKAMLEKVYPALKQKTISEQQVNYLADANLIAQATNSNNHTYFTIVRNPLVRLVSVYRGFFENNSPGFIYRDYLFGVLPQHLSFSDFVNRVICIPDRLKDQHLKPQYCFLEYYEKKNITVKIFKLEDTEKINPFLNQNNLQLPHLNKSAERYDYRLYFTTNLLKVACEVYQKDIERFGYKAEVEALKGYIKTVH